MNKNQLIQKITEKKEFSRLPEKDVEIAFEKFEKKNLNEYQKLKLTRSLLRKVYSSFSSRKLLGDKKKEEDLEWFLGKHKSTKERREFYEEVYRNIFERVKEKEISVIDLGAGINGLSYNFMEKVFHGKINYLGIEGVGQLVDLMNNYFLENKISGRGIHESLFELEKIKKLILGEKKPIFVFLFKVIDSLESLERDYSKRFLLEIVPLCDKFVLSFATKSLGKRSQFSARRSWILKFIKENFNVVDEWEIGGEKYIVFHKK